MRHNYVVTYDISDPKRLRKVYKMMLGYGEHLQLSVFQCELNLVSSSSCGRTSQRSFTTTRIKSSSPTSAR